jgi:hypothetical protein
MLASIVVKMVINHLNVKSQEKLAVVVQVVEKDQVYSQLIVK